MQIRKVSEEGLGRGRIKAFFLPSAPAFLLLLAASPLPRFIARYRTKEKKESALSLWTKVNVSLINQSTLYLSLLYFRVFSSLKLTLGVPTYRLFTVHHKNNNSNCPYQVWQSERWPRTWRVSDPEQNNVPQAPPRVNMASCDHTGAQNHSVLRPQQSANK